MCYSGGAPVDAKATLLKVRISRRDSLRPLSHDTRASWPPLVWDDSMGALILDVFRRVHYEASRIAENRIY